MNTQSILKENSFAIILKKKTGFFILILFLFILISDYSIGVMHSNKQTAIACNDKSYASEQIKQ